MYWPLISQTARLGSAGIHYVAYDVTKHMLTGAYLFEGILKVQSCEVYIKK